MRVLAISVAHDSSVCIMNDGKIEFFCKEERLSHLKHDKNPLISLQKAKEFLGKSRADFAVYVSPGDLPGDVMSETLFNDMHDNVRKFFGLSLMNISHLYSHHRLHATQAFYNSGFSEAIVLVVDRNGSFYCLENTKGEENIRETESVFYYDGTIQQPLYKAYSKKSDSDIGLFLKQIRTSGMYADTDIVMHSSFGVVKAYEAATTMLGLSPLENGKTMGLSSYGIANEDHKLFHEGSPIDSNFFYSKVFPGNPVIFSNHFMNAINYDNFLNLEEYSPEFKYYASLAKDVQVQTQEECLKLIDRYRQFTDVENVVVVGGYAHNIVANSYYVESLPFLNFYFEPVPDDTSTSVGAAILFTLYHNDGTKDISIEGKQDTFYHYYEKEEVSDGIECTVDDIVQFICDNKSVGVFQGTPEAGQRALGNRSILFDPRDQEAKNKINIVKEREWYRPFAGIILEEYFDEYFETLGENGYKNSRNMTMNFKAKQKAIDTAPGIIHVDGTCRVQTVRKEDGKIYEILKAFYDKTGCPMLLNTSMNLAGSPLVHTVFDAMIVLQYTSLDYVYFADYNVYAKKNMGNDE